jgi:Zn-dependent protease with chaperone function
MKEANVNRRFGLELPVVCAGLDVVAMKKFVPVIFCLILAGCAAKHPKMYWRVKDMVLGQGALVDLRAPDQKVLLEVPVRSMQEAMLAHLRISRTAGVTTELYIVDGDDPNAFAGVVNNQRVTAINLAMIKLLAGNIDEYAALIGHEVAHWVKGHGASGKTRSDTLNAVGTLVGIGLGAAGVPAAGLISGLGVDLIDSAYDRDQEREADALSIDYVIANKYDPRGAISLHEKFLKIDSGVRLPFLSSHPSGEERIENLKALIEAKESQRQ